MKTLQFLAKKCTQILAHTPKNIEIVLKDKKIRKSSEEAYASSSKVSKAKRISNKIIEAIIVESDEEKSKKISL